MRRIASSIAIAVLSVVVVGCNDDDAPDDLPGPEDRPGENPGIPGVPGAPERGTPGEPDP